MRGKLPDNLRYCSKHIKDFKMYPCVYCGYVEGDQCPGTIFDDAADEIERLQAEVDRLKTLLIWQNRDVKMKNTQNDIIEE